MHNLQPLSGLKIVVTRPREQADNLAQHIIQVGGQAILFPLLAIHPAANTAALNKQVARLEKFNLAIFISPNAVRYGMNAVLATGESSQILSKLKIAAMGPGSVQALREYGVHEVIAPPNQFGQAKFDSETLLAQPELQAVAGWKVMIFRGDGGRELLGETLKMRGAEVEYATCYQRSKPSADISKLLVARPDAITVTSSEALNYFYELLDVQSKEIMFPTPLFVPHERIANAARKLGWQTVTLTQGGDEGLLSGLLAWANNSNS
jgi:uroporphyrinogen-III synthase